MKKIIQLLIVILLLGSLNALKAQCSANFTYTVLAGNNVNFVSTSTFTNAGTNYTWAFGDGIIGTGAVASHQYSTSGVYSTTLSIINSGPTCTSSVVQTVSVTTSSCSVTPNFSYTVNPGGVVNFVNTSTGTSSLFTTYWDFGDGTTSNAPSFVTHTYTSNGLFNVNLYIMDSLTFACYTNTIIPVSISGLPCSVSSSFSYSFGYSNGTVFFYNSTTPISNAIVTNWNFGDGNTSTTASPIHTYSTSGTYSVSLISSEGTTSCTSIFVNTLTIIPCTLTANFTYTLGNNGLVTFSNTSSPTTSNTVANWYFGDGNSNWGNVVTNNYSSNGLFYVHLTISDSITGMSWCNDTITIPISISNVTCSLGGTTAYAYSYGYNGLGYFSSNITSTNTTSSIWYYGDGTQSPILSTYNYSGNHTYSINGIYTATFVVWENSSPSCSLSISTVSFVINGATCSLVANFNYTLGSSGMVTFNDASTGTSSLTNYYWDFGDGNYAYGSALTSTVNNYLTNGLYNVTLNVIDSLNPCWDYTVIPVNINNSPNLGCNANSVFNLYKDYSAAFSWYGYPNYQSNAVSATWNWGDGTSTVGFYPTHTYSAAGYYNICLTVSLSCGSQSSTCNNTNIYRTTASSHANNSMLTLNIVNSTAVGIKTIENSLSDAILYPNPNTGKFQINLPTANEQYSVEIYNSLGQLIYQNTLTDKPVINIESSPSGMYYAKLKGKENGKTFKFIKN